MSSIKYENQILNAIETVVNNAVEKAGYDKTIKAQIIEKTNESIGEYKVRYQDSLFFAYSTNLDITYPKNSLVYILIPSNDMRQVKTIIGAVEKTDLEYEEILEAEDYYDIIGTNVLNNDNEFALCSYNGSTNIVLFDKDNEINLVNFDEQTFKIYLTNKYNILCGGWFKIILDDIQKNRGNYGISFDMKFKDPLDETHILTKTYTMDVNNMEGNPYSFNNFTRQANIFNVDTENYIELDKIIFFAKDFPKIESGHANDIFLKTPILYVAEEIPEAVLNGYSVKIITDKNYFNENDNEDTSISLQAIVKRKGKELSDTKTVQYLWFKENAEVYPAMPGFNSYGGSGWECLNSFNILDDSDPLNIQKEYITNVPVLNITKSECQALDNNYKVVVLIGENSNVENSIVIKNYDYEYNLSISSDEGTKFYYGNGTPTLTLLVNGHENNDFTYKWISIDENNISTILEDTIEDNAIYNAAVENYNTLKAAVDSETVLPNAVEEQLNNYLETINSFDTKQRVEGNKIYKVQINEVPTYIIYKCSVYDGNNLIGTSSIKLNNYPRIEGEYFLNIENGTQTFNYDSAGISPASITLEHPMALSPLSFTIVDGKGNLLPDRIIDLCEVEWIYDEGNSLINVNSYDNRKLYYSLAEIYNISKINTSNITLKVTYQDLKLQAQTNFTFIKDGEPGTNGTDVICKIVPYTENENFSDYPVLYYNNNGDWALNFIPISNYRWFKVQLWKDNNLLWEGTNSKKRDNVIVKWSMLGNKYSDNVIDKSHINIVENSLLDDEYFNYSFYFNNVDSQLSNNQNVADILKVEITYKDKKYYSTLPIITVKTEDWTNYQYSLARHSGFRYVTYTADGCYPQYENTNPFTIKVWEKINDYLEDISNLTTNENYKLNYVWEICGSDYYIGNNENIASWHLDLKLVEKGIMSNQGLYIPVEEFDGKNVSISLRVTISQNGNVIGIMNIPIHFYLNRYGISTLNDWDGNHIEINENNDTILAPQVGAGRKEADNSFTGVLMGEVLESGQKDSQYGLYGYYQGDRTIELNAQNGSAKFGKVGAGQIILDPTDDTAKLKSGNYIAPVLDSNGNVITPGQGLEIDLTDPHIIFGSGKFRVDNDGSVHATEYTTISDLEGGAYTIPQSSVENLSTFINTTNTSIENLQDQIDGNITTWFYAYVPTLNNEPASAWTTTTDKDNHLGDLFYDTSTGYCYRFMKNGDIYSWQQLSDSDIAAALAAAQAAQDTADHKRRVFYSTPTPPYDLGDLWVQGENGDILRCATAKTVNQSYVLADWVLASKYTDDAVANAVQQNLDNLVIGARNYLLKSNTEISWNRTNTNTFQNVPFSPLLKELPDSTELTISFLAKCNEAAEDLKIDFYLRNNSNSMSTLYEMDTLTTEYKKYVHVIKVDSGKHLADTTMCRFRLGAGSGIASIKEYKLEAGNRATAWSPAPEDNIQSLDVEYYLSTSTDSPTGGSWSVTAPEWEDGKYMWSRQKITYGNGTVETKNQTCIAGATGATGAAGENGSGIKYFGTRSWTNAEITNTYKIGYSSTWSNNLHIETKAGDLLLLYVTNSTYGTKYDYILEVTAGSTTSTTPTAKIIAITKDGDAPVVNIIPSAQVFKSTEGAAGTFTPEYIYLYPVLKNCAYSKWQYSTDGTTWTDVSSGSHGLTIGTYDTMANTLRISRDSDLYTNSITSISFKCLSGLSTAYDVTSIVKIYDVTDIEVGGTNLIYNSGEFDNEMTYWAKNGGTTLEIATVDNYRVLHALGSVKQDPAKVIYHLNWGTSYVYHAYVKFSIGGIMTSSAPLASWIYKTNNYNDIGASNDAATINNFYVDTPGNKTILANTWHHIVIYFTTIAKPNDYQYVNMLPFFDGSPFITNSSGSDYYIRWIKLEKGTLFTDWSPAPEDANTIIDSIAAAISEGVVRIADGNILIADNASAPTHIIIMNHNGIAFFNAQQAWPSLQEIETASATSAWSIAGDLNMNSLKGGTLKLGNASNTNGVIEVYNGNGVLVNKIDKDGLQLKVGSAFENVGTIVDNIGEAYSHITSLTDTNDSEIIDFDMEGCTDQLYNEWGKPYALQSIGYTNLFNKSITMIQNGAFKTEINSGARLTATVAGNWTYAYVQLGGSELLGKTITISSTLVTNASNQGCIALFFASSSNIAHTSIDSSLRGSGFKTVTIKIPSSFPSGADRINLLLYANGGGTGTIGCYTEYHDLIITEGIARGYVPYGKYGIEIWSLGKNLFNKNDIVEGKLNSSGEVISDDSYVTSNYIPIIGNRGNLTISNNSGNNEYVCLYDMDFGLSNAINIGSSTTKTINMDNLCHYLRVTVNKTKLNEYQVQYGSSSSSYQEHQSSQITYVMDEPLRSINEVADTIYVNNGAVYLERKIGSTVWNGTEEWFQYEEGIFDTLENKKRIPASGDDGYILTSSLQQWSDTSGVPWMEGSAGEVAENKYIYVNYGFMSLQEWKSTLADNNIEVLYLLEKPTITRISLELPKTYKSETSITPTTRLVQGIYHLKYIKGNILSDYIEDRLSRTQTEFSVTADEISSKVGRGDVVSSINQSAEQITINADKISLAGKTINLTSDNIAINSTNFKVTKEGNVTANNLALTGGSVSGVNINLTGSNYQDVKFQISSTDGGNSYSTKISPAELISKETSPNDPNYSGIGNSNQTWEALTTYSTLAYFNVFSKDCSLSDGVYKTSFGGSCDYNGNVSFSVYARRSNYNEAGVRSYIYSGWTNSPTVGIALFTADSSSPQTEVTTAKVKAPVIQQTSVAESKKDIELFNKSALSLINNSDIYTYHLKTEEEANKKHIGLVIGDNYKCCDEVIAEDNQSVVLYTLSSLSWKAIQELTEEIKELKKEIKGE